MKVDCKFCGIEIDYEPVMCCSGRDCGCLGKPTEPPWCDKCYHKINQMRIICEDCGCCSDRQLSLKTGQEILNCETFKIMYREFYEITSL